MLILNAQIELSEFQKLYDIIITKDHLLRKIKENIDFSFVNPMLKESYSEKFGRPAKEPEMMFKILFLKKMYDLSDEALVQNIEVNMAYKYFLDMNPEDKTVDSSLLTKFRKTRITNENLEEMLKETIRQAIEKGLIKSTAIIVDATHTKSSAKHETPTQILRKHSKELRKELYKSQIEISKEFPEKPVETADLNDEIEYSKKLVEVVEKSVGIEGSEKAKKLLHKVKETLENDKIKEMQSSIDTDAKLGHKSEQVHFMGYKNHIAMTEERLISGLVVTSGEASDGKILVELIEQSQNNGIKVDEVLGDTAYSGVDNLKYAKKHNIKMISKLNPIISNGTGQQKQGFIYNKDADLYQCPAGYLAEKKALSGKKNQKCNQRMTYFFDIKKCKNCALKDGCYKENAKTNTFCVTILSETHSKQKEFQESEYFKTRAKQRYMIEAKNAELKQSHGLETADSVGVIAMRLQSYFTAFAANVKRIIKLREVKTV